MIQQLYSTLLPLRGFVRRGLQYYIRAMKLPRFAWPALIASVVLASAARAQSPSAVDAFKKFWEARSPSDAAKLVDVVLKTGVTYEAALQQLKQGRTYSPQKTGVVMMTNKTDDKVEHYYAVNVPAGYDPAKRYQVRFQLHGGVMGRSTNQPRNSGSMPNSGCPFGPGAIARPAVADLAAFFTAAV